MGFKSRLRSVGSGLFRLIALTPRQRRILRNAELLMKVGEARRGGAELTPRERRKFEARYDLTRAKRRLFGSRAARAKKTFGQAYAISIACGPRSSRLAKYASEHPGKVFVGVDAQKLSPAGKKLVRALPNLFFVQAEAIEALKLVESNSKRVFSMDNFPYFDAGNDLPQNTKYRKELFAEAFRALVPGGLLR